MWGEADEKGNAEEKVLLGRVSWMQMYSIGCIALVEVHHVEQQSGHERLSKHSLLLTRHDGYIRLPDISTDTYTDSTPEFHKPIIIFPL